MMTDNQSGGIMAWSNYICYEHITDPKFRDMIPGIGESLLDFAYHLITDLYRNEITTVASVIDIGRIPGKGWAVIETNQAWASGIYGCDPDGVLSVLEESCEINDI